MRLRLLHARTAAGMQTEWNSSSALAASEAHLCVDRPLRARRDGATRQPRKFVVSRSPGHMPIHGSARRRQRHSASRCRTRNTVALLVAQLPPAPTPEGLAAVLHASRCPGRPAEARIRISASPRRAARCVLPIHAQRGIFARRVAHSARAIGPGSSSQWTDSGMCASPATGTPQRMKASVIPAVLAACGHCLTCTAPMQLGACSVPCACDANAGS